jgi:uncharacterized protein (TIGR03083 family)
VRPERLGPPSDVRDLFERDRARLLHLLAELRPADWDAVTAAAPWTVRDVVAHLLGDDVGRLARTRDDHAAAGPRNGESLPAFLDRINAEWVAAAARISPPALRSLLATTTPEIAALWRAADLQALGEPVSWAGSGPAPVWLDCARDYTEYWVHQQQIREATGRPDTGGPDAVHAVLDTFLRAVPYTLDRDRPTAPVGTSVVVRVPGTDGGTWQWQRSPAGWGWSAPRDGATTTITVDADPLWRVCVRMIDPVAARAEAHVEGDETLAAAVLSTVSIIRG